MLCFQSVKFFRFFLEPGRFHKLLTI